jgi:acyl-CoA thioesterase I
MINLPDMEIKGIFIVSLIMLVACGENSRDASTAANTPAKDTATASTPVPLKTIVFFGNSLTAGYGLADASEAFPSIIQHKIDSLKLPYKVINAGVSGETSSGGNSRIDWILRESPDVFVLELGANDGLRGISPVETRKNLQAIIDKVKAKNPNVIIVIAGMMMPPNMGQQYTAQFRNIFPDLAKANNVKLIPFLLEGVGGEVKFNQEDGIHPTAEGHQILADNVWKVMEALL